MRGVVFDTSIWMEYLKGNPKYFDVCQELLENGRVFGLELIFAELLQGAKSKREVNVILEYASLVPTLDEPFLVMASGLLSYHAGLVHHGVGVIDAIIFNAVQKNELQLWTLDKKLKQIVGSIIILKTNLNQSPSFNLTQSPSIFFLQSLMKLYELYPLANWSFGLKGKCLGHTINPLYLIFPNFSFNLNSWKSIHYPFFIPGNCTAIRVS